MSSQVQRVYTGANAPVPCLLCSGLRHVCASAAACLFNCCQRVWWWPAVICFLRSFSSLHAPAGCMHHVMLLLRSIQNRFTPHAAVALGTLQFFWLLKLLHALLHVCLCSVCHESRALILPILLHTGLLLWPFKCVGIPSSLARASMPLPSCQLVAELPVCTALPGWPLPLKPAPPSPHTPHLHACVGDMCCRIHGSVDGCHVCS